MIKRASTDRQGRLQRLRVNADLFALVLRRTYETLRGSMDDVISRLLQQKSGPKTSRPSLQTRVVLPKASLTDCQARLRASHLCSTSCAAGREIKSLLCSITQSSSQQSRCSNPSLVQYPPLLSHTRSPCLQFDFNSAASVQQYQAHNCYLQRLLLQLRWRQHTCLSARWRAY